MTLWLRLLLLVVALPFRPKVTLFEGVRQNYRVLPTDVDVNFHLTNSRYASFADLARLGLMARSGLLRAAFANGWRPMLLASKIRFRREIKPFGAFRVETRLRWWNDVSAIFEVRFIKTARDGSDVLSAIALERGGVYSRKEKRFVTVDELFRELGVAPFDPPEATPEILAFVAAEEEMRNIS